MRPWPGKKGVGACSGMAARGAGERSATAAALALLARRDYSSAALRQRLLRKGFSEAEAEEACRRCAGAGYLDDERYGHWRVRRRLQRRPCGRRAAVADLRRQGLPGTMSEAIVEAAFAEAGGEEAVLREALRRWRARHGEPTSWASAKRCFDHLVRRQFPRSVVRRALSDALDRLSG